MLGNWLPPVHDKPDSHPIGRKSERHSWLHHLHFPTDTPGHLQCSRDRHQWQPLPLSNRVIQDHSIPRLYNRAQPILPNRQKRLHHNVHDTGNRNKRLQQYCLPNCNHRTHYTPWSRNLSALLGRPLFHFNPHCFNNTQHANRHVHDHGDRHQRLIDAHLYRDSDSYKLDPHPQADLAVAPSPT